MTLVPELAKGGAQVTMLQRSPTYVVSRPGEDKVANWLRTKLPDKLAYDITRWKNVLLGMFFYRLARKKPEQTKQRLLGMVRDHLGPDYDVATHFTPRYNPWDQRLCLVPDADLFDAIKAGQADVVTDTIAQFEADGIRLDSGTLLPADIIVTATGLDLQLMSGVDFSVDGHAVENVSGVGRIQAGRRRRGGPGCGACDTNSRRQLGRLHARPSPLVCVFARNV